MRNKKNLDKTGKLKQIHDELEEKRKKKNWKQESMGSENTKI